MVVTDAGILLSDYKFSGGDPWTASSRLIPWHAVTGVDVEQGGPHHSEAMITALEVRSAEGSMSLPLKEDHRELSEDETDVVRAILSRRTA